MKEQQGWITLSRKLLDNPIFKKPDYLAVWMFLLLKANHKETSFIWNNKKHTLKKGQLLTGRKKIAQVTGIAESQIYKILKYLELEQQIEQQKTTKFTIITIINWDKYQQKEQQKEQQSNNRVTTKEQQSNTYNNGNNGNKDNNIPKGMDKGVSYKENSVSLIQKALKKDYPYPLQGITDRRRLYNLVQVLSPRSGTDEWMDSDWKKNFVSFMNTYLQSTEEKYYARGVDTLKEKAKLWREYRGKLN
jgi:hypothetical protein